MNIYSDMRKHGLHIYGTLTEWPCEVHKIIKFYGNMNRRKTKLDTIEFISVIIIKKKT